ncbi:ABC-type amino acid transport/signal transduction systems, periplasmic component/domain [Candidatus Scalindua japonica]|uniref:ABC-type amino acid transport/signal transduction systems, periplasmic component/domain n=1 Tax=Candidatus Scalindua japonica TaxID=1284222 RepID=A0A286TWY2_9BACT|nr:hypothetical protein [Candidatus Scalindua japonica]GAX60384.1 ABC-type amino acid transport/signal transduction systems, periplasmic component/domain [Candidatus Scalindua japonica]
MSQITFGGRKREVAEIVKFERAAQVGLLLLGELDGEMELIFPDSYIEKPRKVLKTRIESIRKVLRGEVAKFCRRNFKNLRPEDLAKLYEPLIEHNSSWRLPLLEFIRDFGEPKERVLKGAPLHSTIILSPWGLQMEYPEMHLFRDMAIAYNNVIKIEKQLKLFHGTSWKDVKEQNKRQKISELCRECAYNRRMCILSCFNLVEAYINGISWAYVQTHDISELSNKKQKILTEGQASIIDKLTKIPGIVANDTEPLNVDDDPLKSFRETIKPFRDSIVHASPFSAPERFGGYEKLSKVYELDSPTVENTVSVTFEIISKIHLAVGEQNPLPDWITRNDEGLFIIEMDTNI